MGGRAFTRKVGNLLPCGTPGSSTYEWRSEVKCRPGPIMKVPTFHP